MPIYFVKCNGYERRIRHWFLRFNHKIRYGYCNHWIYRFRYELHFCDMFESCSWKSGKQKSFWSIKISQSKIKKIGTQRLTLFIPYFFRLTKYAKFFLPQYLDKILDGTTLTKHRILLRKWPSKLLFLYEILCIISFSIIWVFAITLLPNYVEFLVIWTNFKKASERKSECASFSWPYFLPTLSMPFIMDGS